MSEEKTGNVTLSPQAFERLAFYSKHLGVEASEIVNDLIIMYLDRDNKDITHCPKCGKPLVWESIITVTGCEVKCECGCTTIID